jgi:hypothetical protein
MNALVLSLLSVGHGRIKRGTAMLHYLGIFLVFALMAGVLCVPGIIHFCGQQGFRPPQNPIEPEN